MEHYLVTGGAGFVGRHVVTRLAHDYPDATIWVIDDLSTGLRPDQWPGEAPRPVAGSGSNAVQDFRLPSGGANIRFICCDATAIFLGELNRIPAVISVRLPQFARAYHYASVVGGRALIDGDPLAVGIDLAIDSSFFLWAAKVNKPDRILYASSSAAYPVGLQTDNAAVALTEDMINFESGSAQPDFTYGWSKLTGEYLGRIAASRYNLRVVSVRPFSGYGEDQEPVYPVPAIAMRAAQRRDPLVVWGTGEQTRDFVHIDDCVEAMERAIIRITDGSAVNIGSGTATSFLQLATLLGDIAGYAPQVRGKAGKPVGVAQRYCDPSMMRAKLDFIPRISLREGMTRVLDRARQRIAAGVEVPE